MDRASAGLSKVMSGLLRHAPPHEAPLLAWPMVCGPAVAARTRALDFSEGVLRVEVPDRTWLAQLADLVGRYLAAMSKLLPGSVERIVFVLPQSASQTYAPGNRNEGH